MTYAPETSEASSPVAEPPPSAPAASIFPRMRSADGTTARWPRRSPDSRSVDVVSAACIAEAESDTRRLAEATDTAAQIVANAHRAADRHAARVREDMRRERAAWFVEQDARYEARVGSALGVLGEAAVRVVEAVIGAVTEVTPELAIQASVDTAVRLLQAEMRRQVLCHPLDIEGVEARLAQLESQGVEACASVTRGELAFHSAQGEVRVDGRAAMAQLAGDLRITLSAAMSLHIPSESVESDSLP